MALRKILVTNNIEKDTFTENQLRLSDTSIIL